MKLNKTTIYILISAVTLLFLSTGIIIYIEKNRTVPADSNISTQAGSTSNVQKTDESTQTTTENQSTDDSTATSEDVIATKSTTTKTYKTTTKATTKKPTTTAPPSVSYTNIKGVWISYLDIANFKSLSQEQFTTNIANCLNYVRSRGLNTVIVHVRSHGDAIYPSSYYPWSKYITTTGSLSYDPLSIIISLAHSKGLSVHAWINPYRVMTDSEFSSVSSSFTTKKWYESSSRADYMIKYNNGQEERWYLKPGNAQARSLIINGVAEIVSKYNVDAIHIDDYFYITSPSTYGDTTAQAKQNNTALVRGIYQKIKSIKPKVLFGISPAGRFDDGSTIPYSDSSYLSTDLNLWCNSTGYIDYVMPQIYWKRGHSTQDFSRVLQQWKGFVKSPSVALYAGLAAYKESSRETNDPFPKGEIAAQIAEIKSTGYSSGYCLFRYDFISEISF